MSLIFVQVQMGKLADTIDDYLTYFMEYDRIYKFLNTSGETNVCMNADFGPVLAKIDDCIAFIESHDDYRDSELYLMRYKQCLGRAFSQIRLQFSTLLRATLSETQQAVQVKVCRC
jgi:hypothetical protein